MYIKPSHKLNEQDAKHIVMNYDHMSLIVTSHDDDIQAVQAPLYYQDGKLIGHMARANPQWRAIGQGSSVLIIMQGPDAYIAPESYPSKPVDGKVVPTWNYERVDVRGRITTFEEPSRLLCAVKAVSDKFENARAFPWSVDDAPQDFINRLLRGIIGIEIEISSILGKSKMDQDESLDNQKGVIDLLSKSADTRDLRVAQIMKDNLEKPISG